MEKMRWTCVALAVLLTGCAGNAYLDAKRNTAAGGQLERDTNAAQRDLDNARVRNDQLRRDQARVDQQIEQDRRRIAAVDSDLRKQDAALAAAIKAGKVSQFRAAALQKELAALKAEAQNAEMANRSQAMAKTSDPKADAAKEQQLRNLEIRKQTLEQALATMAK